jgi:putative outer membrane protein
LCIFAPWSNIAPYKLNLIKTAMKKTFILAAALVIGLGFTACKQQTKEATPATNDSTQVANDSTATDGVKALFTTNDGKTPTEINLLDNADLKARMQKLVGGEYDNLVKNFNTVTPIVSENGIYKTTGGKAHEVPAYQTTIYYDANNDNLNVIISQNDKDKTYVEKDTIKVTDALKSK